MIHDLHSRFREDTRQLLQATFRALGNEAVTKMEKATGARRVIHQARSVKMHETIGCGDRLETDVRANFDGIPVSIAITSKEEKNLQVLHRLDVVV